ncbi:hypothetical protein LPMP_110830 [Leishmania panamensis]|uniref:Uncharacterized protein n=1 Tax=Leishmania panamensis TaxID=5679 RepID=A0A088RK35_LEIPA|nr:hypothetical protein LPMP_110830 [Leishmania panamensis]AIN96278.1 hypothetical protein LPMP_110830 [Leishmania panamensis]
MPPKTAVSVVRNGALKPHPKNGERHAPVKEEASVGNGPQVKSQIANSAPAPAGKSFLDALRSGKKPAAPAAAARVSVPAAAPAEEPQAAAAPTSPVAAAAPVKQSSAPEPAKEERTATPEPMAASVEEPSMEESAPAPVEGDTGVVAASAAEEPAPIMQVEDTNFNWADDDIQFQIRQPQYAAEYPMSVMENLARNVAFKVPADQNTITSAIEALAHERQAFEQLKRNHEDAMKNREVELNAQEASLQARERQLHANTETLAAERQQLILQQSQFRAQQQAQAQAQAQSQSRTSQTQSPAAQVSPSSALAAPPAHAPPLQHQMPPPHQQPQPRSGNVYMGGSYGAQEWQPDQRTWGNDGTMGAPGFDMYQGAYPGSYAQRNYHMAGGHRGPMRSGNLQQQQFAGNRVPPMMAPPQQYSRSMGPLGPTRQQQQMEMNFGGRSQQSYNPTPNTGYPQRSSQW